MQKVSFFVQSGHFFARRLGWILDQGFNLLLVTGIEQIHLTRFVIKKIRQPTQNP